MAIQEGQIPMGFNKNAVLIGSILAFVTIVLLLIGRFYFRCNLSGYFSESTCEGTIETTSYVRYGKGDDTMTLFRGDDISVHYEYGNDYIFFVEIKGKVYPAWIPKSDVTLK